MEQKTSRRVPVFRLGLGWCLALTLPLALAEMLLALYIQPGPLRPLLSYMKDHLLLVLLNFLPFWLLTLCGYFLFANPFFASALVGGVGGVLSIVNRTMVEKRDEPLSPKDFGLLKEAGDAIQSYDLNLHVPSIVMTVLFVVIMFLIGLIFRGKRPLTLWWKNLCFALLGAAVSFGILVGCIRTVYSSKELHESFPIRAQYHMTSIYEQLGFPYCFCYHFNTYQVEKPEGFSAQEAASYAQQHPVSDDQGLPVNVILVMNEAFSDVTNFEAFDYPEGQEPLQFFNSLKNSDQAITGHIVVPNFGAGTANTEFDVITGMQTNMISETGASAFRVLNHDVESIFRIFLEDGYQTEFIHPGQEWFYNRQNVYKYFGAEKLMFSQEFSEAERLGQWVTDAAVLDVLKAEYEAAVAANQPYFNYTVTIQNHMSYSTEKYGDLVVPQAPMNQDIEEKAHSMLSVYAKGVRDADQMLEDLTEYYSSRPEPVLLVFFGDHLTILGDSYYCYQQMGMDVGEGKNPEATLRTYKTPYVIWVNHAAVEQLNFSQAKEALDLPSDHVINANYLGAVILELTGRRDANSFFSYLNDLRRELPVLHKSVGRGADNRLFEELPEQYEEVVRKMRFWQYYRLKIE